MFLVKNVNFNVHLKQFTNTGLFKNKQQTNKSKVNQSNMAEDNHVSYYEMSREG